MIKQDTVEGVLKPDVFLLTAELVTEKLDFKSDVNTLRFIRFYCDDKMFLSNGFELRVQCSEDDSCKDYFIHTHPVQYQETVIDFQVETPIDIRLHRIFVSSSGLQSDLNFKFFLDNSKV